MNILFARPKGLGIKPCEKIAANMQHKVTVWRTDRPVPEGKFDYTVRWGWTGAWRGRIINKLDSIRLGSNKKDTRLILAEHGLAPKTWPSFAAWRAEEDDSGDYDDVILRPRYHKQGKEILRYNLNQPAAERANPRPFVAKHPDHYVSTYIPKVAEYRVFVMAGRVVAVASKNPEDKAVVAWNCMQGASYKNVRWGEWNLEACRVALEACKIIGPDFSGVDVMVDAGGRCYVLELNSAPSLESPYREKLMGRVFDHFIDSNRAHMEAAGYDNWRQVIHPAVSDAAEVPVDFEAIA